MTNKYVLYAFQGEEMCVVHVWLNALDMHEKGMDVKVVIEGSATSLIKEYHDNEKSSFRGLYLKVKNLNLIHAVCKACATKMGALKAAEMEGLPIIGNMSGHPSMADYITQGYQIITF